VEDKDFSYRSLIVWQKAMQFAKVVYGFLAVEISRMLTTLIKKYHPLLNSNS